MKIESSHSPYEAGGQMDKPYDEATIQHQFDTLIKNVLKHEAKSYLRELQKRAELDMKLQELFWNESPIQMDHYKCECFQICTKHIGYA